MDKSHKALTKKKCSKCGGYLTFQVTVENGVSILNQQQKSGV